MIQSPGDLALEVGPGLRNGYTPGTPGAGTVCRRAEKASALARSVWTHEQHVEQSANSHSKTTDMNHRQGSCQQSSKAVNLP